MKKGSIFSSLILMLLLSVQAFASSYYGPTIANDRLYRIALALQPSRQLDVQQVMVGIYEYNTYAFIDNNINGLYAGILLYIPTVEELSEVDASYAHNLIRRHNKEWKNIHPKLVAQTNPQSKLVAQDSAIASALVVKNDDILEPAAQNNKLEAKVANITEGIAAKVDEHLAVKADKLVAAKTDDVDRTVSEAPVAKQDAVVAAKPDSTETLDKQEHIEHTIFSKLDKVPVKEKVASDSASAQLKEILVAKSYTADLQKIQKQISSMQTQLVQILVALEDKKYAQRDMKSALDHKYVLFDSSQLESGNDGAYYTAFSIDSDTAYMEWIIAAIMSLTTLGMIVTNQRENYVDIGVDLENMDDDEYDYIGSTDGVPIKLNLAKAYCEMGNTEKAQKTLNEVIAKGNKSQQAEAKDILAEITKK